MYVKKKAGVNMGDNNKPADAGDKPLAGKCTGLSDGDNAIDSVLFTLGSAAWRIGALCGRLCKFSGNGKSLNVPSDKIKSLAGLLDKCYDDLMELIAADFADYDICKVKKDKG